MDRKVSVKRLIRLFAGMALAAVSCTQPIASTDTTPVAPSVPGVPTAVITVESGAVSQGALYQTTDGTSISFSGTSSTAVSGNLTYEWDFGDNSLNVAGETVNHSFSPKNTYTVTLTVTDDVEGSFDTDTVEILINEPPSISIDQDPADLAADLGQSLSFSATGSDSDGEIVAYSWALGDINSTTIQGSLSAGGSVPPVNFTYSYGGSKTVSLTVTDNEGTQSSDTVTAEISDITQPVADFSIAAPLDGIGHQTGDGIVFTNQSSDPGGKTLSYVWDFGDGSAPSAAKDPAHPYSAAGDYTVRLVTTNTDNNLDWITRQISINDPPTPSITDIPAGNWINRGESFTLNCTVEDDNDATFSYVWQVDGITASTSASLTYTHNTADDITVTLTVTDGTGHSGTDTVSLEVNEAPAVSFITDSSRINPNGSIQFTSTASDPDGDTISYDWDFDDGNSSSAVNPSHSFTDPGSYTITLTVTDPHSSQDSDSAVITVNAPPEADFTSPVYAVEGESITFTDASTDTEDSSLDYSWDFGDSGTAATTSPNHTYVAYGSYTVTLEVTDDDGLTDSATTTIEINALPMAAITGTPAGDTVNQYEPFSLTGSSSSDPDDSIASYLWTMSDNTTYTTADITHTFTTDADGDITLQVTDQDGETDTATYAIEVVANALPTAAITGTPIGDMVDAGTELILNGDTSSDSDGTIDSYLWTMSDGTTTYTTANISHTYSTNADGDITLQVTDDDGETDTATYTIGVNMAPTAAFTQDTTSVLEGGAVTFDASGSSDPDGDSMTYSWDFGDGGTITGVNPSHTYSTAGTYTVELTVFDTRLDDALTMTDLITVTAP